MWWWEKYVSAYFQSRAGSQNWSYRTLPKFSHKCCSKVPPQGQTLSVLAFFLPVQMFQISTGPSALLIAAHPRMHATRECYTVPPVSIVLVDSLVHVLLKVCEFWKGNKRLWWTRTVSKQTRTEFPGRSLNSLLKNNDFPLLQAMTHESSAGLTISHLPPARKEDPHRRLTTRCEGTIPFTGLRGRKRRWRERVGGKEKPAAPGALLTCEHIGDSPVESLLWRLPFAHGGPHPKTPECSEPGTAPLSQL